ncbi:16S rRNA (uracil(1498)-N(3))-methyltransferase [Mycoplasmopsis lipofaciens]|uniref:16S rRNA (uracil(1498)-N(3))-methyltransferase n=1 Tax=Mycoplasmopsis lipofaciens TaxID=114884 RepID=UPI0004878010|nr:16S rRNA (uracil(1498)-N(3))-methyltransferase [Mycoplasmopsis lipofaciens]
MHRFFVENKINQDYFELSKENLKHIKVARLENEFFLCNYLGCFYKCILENNLAKIIETTNINNEAKYQIILACPIIKIKRFEWILQKATELGVTKIIPIITRYTDNNIVKYDLKKKYNRFLDIIKNAAQQSFRNIIPELLNPMQLEKFLSFYKDLKKYIAYENETVDSQVNYIELLNDTILIVGPEGGFSEEEIKMCQNYEAQVVSLGKRILRAETACLYMLSNLKEA